MERRDFNRGLIGSVLGLVAGKPFIAQAMPMMTQEVPTLRNLTTLDQYKLLVWTPEQDLILAPRLKEIQVRPGQVNFVAEDIEIGRSIEASGAVIINPERRIMGSRAFVQPITPLLGDVLRIEYCLSWPAAATLEEMMEHIGRTAKRNRFLRTGEDARRYQKENGWIASEDIVRLSLPTA